MNPLVDQSGRPTPEVRWASHALVGGIAGAVVHRYRGPAAAVIALLLVALAHESLDAPVASALVSLLE